MNDEKSDLPPDRLWQPNTVKWFAVDFGACLFYGVIRYHFAGDAEDSRGLALEAKSAPGLPGSDPCCRSPGGPRFEGLVDAEGLAGGAASDQPDIPFGGFGSPCCQEQSHLREATAEEAGAVTARFCSGNAKNRMFFSNNPNSSGGFKHFSTIARIRHTEIFSDK